MNRPIEIKIECTLNLHKRLVGIKFKNRASRAIFEIKKFVKSLLNSNEIKIDTVLNREIRKFGTRHTPTRIRIRITKQNFVSRDNTQDWIIFVTSGNNLMPKVNKTIKH